jgi:hypothetical protein
MQFREGLISAGAERVLFTIKEPKPMNIAFYN